MSTPPLEPGEGPGEDDIDAEFARMMQGMDLDAPADLDESGDIDQPAAPGAPEVPADGASPADATGPSGAPLIPDTPEGLFDAADGEESTPPIAVVATSVASAKALAGAVRLGQEARTDGTEVPEGTRIIATDTGAIAVGTLPEASAHDLAAVVSTALQRHGVVLFWRRGERMTATRYRQGERGDDVSPALVLGAVDDAVEQLLLGAVEASELPGAGKDGGIDPRAVSRSQALRWIATGRRRP